LEDCENAQITNWNCGTVGPGGQRAGTGQRERHEGHVGCQELGDYANHRYSTLDQINKDNVKDLQVAWTFSTGVLRGHEGSPLVIGDMMYVHTPFPNNVYALDLSKGGKIVWTYEPKQDPNVIPVMCCDTVNRGVAYADGMIFLHQADTTVVALDAKTGEESGRRQRRSVQGRDQHRDRSSGEGQGDRRYLRR
jgi:glucose dehydrogenase